MFVKCSVPRFRYIIKYESLVPGPSLFTDSTFSKPDMDCTDFTDNGLALQEALPLQDIDAEFNAFAKKQKRQYKWVPTTAF